MRKIKSKINKILLIATIFALNLLVFINSSQALSINSAYLYSIGDCGQLLKYKGSIVKVSYVQYIHDGVEYPAYCLDKRKPGAETQSYTVSVDKAINDVGLWRIIINGYPYKTIEELGVQTKEEAFTATKQAVYCYIHGNNPADYQGIGIAGERTLNAMNQILYNAQNSNETKISTTIQINKNNDEWKQDEIDKKYVSKTYSISADGTITSYSITLSKENGEDLGGIKLTNLQNEETNNFQANEKFKILIPIKILTEKGNFNISVETKIKTKPVLYGTAPNSSFQDYALSAATYEDGNGNTTDNYQKNETKIIIIKKDKDTGEKIENVEFELLDENKNIVYTGLKTDAEGKIEIDNVIPGKYYLRETKSVEGYEKYEELIEFELTLNEQITIEVNNTKKDEPEVEIYKPKRTKEVKKLPVTGM